MIRKIETKKYDFVVIGGGMSGICAALAAARNGAKTALIHNRSVLGGNASSEVRIHISGASDSQKKPELEESGILYELMLDNKAQNDWFSYPLWDAVLFNKVRFQQNLDLYMNTVMLDADCEQSLITRVRCFQETTEKHLVLEAPLFADCTGNGTLGYFVGAEFMTGSESRADFGELHAPEKTNNFRMGNTILFRAVNRGEPVKFTPPPFAKKLTEQDLHLRIHSSKLPDYSQAEDPEEYRRVSSVSSAGIEYGYWWLELTGDGEDIIEEYEDIRDELYAYFYGVWDHIKNGGDHGAQNYDLEWVGALPGMRESRRLRGDYILNERDILNHRMFEDSVAYGGWGIDLHAPHGLKDRDLLPSQVWTFDGTYTIPYRCYYSKNIKNLFMAGRNISASKLGMASTRVIGTCAVGGQAVGSAAALCVQKGILPRELCGSVFELQQLILKDDGFIPGVKNEDKGDLARYAEFTASSHIADFLPQCVISGVSREFGAGYHSWRCKMESYGAWIHARLAFPAELSQINVTFDSNFNYSVRVTMSPARQKQQRRGVPPELTRDFDIVLYKDEKIVKTVQVRNNHQRFCPCRFEKTLCDSFKIKIRATMAEEHKEVLRKY